MPRRRPWGIGLSHLPRPFHGPLPYSGGDLLYLPGDLLRVVGKFEAIGERGLASRVVLVVEHRQGVVDGRPDRWPSPTLEVRLDSAAISGVSPDLRIRHRKQAS